MEVVLRAYEPSMYREMVRAVAPKKLLSSVLVFDVAVGDAV